MVVLLPTLCRYGAGKVSSGANVDGAPLPEDVEENGKEEEVGEFGFHTLVGLSVCLACSNLNVHLPVKPMPYHPSPDILLVMSKRAWVSSVQTWQQQAIPDKSQSPCILLTSCHDAGKERL